MRNIGVVVQTDGNLATVKISRKSACGENCASCKGGCSLSETKISALNKCDAKTGDRVVTEIDDNIALCAALIAYMLPVFTAVLPGIIGYCMELNDKILCGICVIGFIVGLCLSRCLSSLFKNRFLVRIVKVIGRI